LNNLEVVFYKFEVNYFKIVIKSFIFVKNFYNSEAFFYNFVVNNFKIVIEGFIFAAGLSGSAEGRRKNPVFEDFKYFKNRALCTN
jgi:hypothetical protein